MPLTTKVGVEFTLNSLIGVFGRGDDLVLGRLVVEALLEILAVDAGRRRHGGENRRRVVVDPCSLRREELLGHAPIGQRRNAMGEKRRLHGRAVQGKSRTTSFTLPVSI